MKRHPELFVRQPKATSAAKAMSFNPENVNKYVDVYEETIEKYHFPPQRNHNCDETGITSVQGKPSKIGKRQVAAERSQLVTVELCMSVTGEFTPPLFLFPRVR